MITLSLTQLAAVFLIGGLVGFAAGIGLSIAMDVLWARKTQRRP